MTTRVLNRRALRGQHDQAHQAEQPAAGETPAPPEAKKPRARKAVAVKPAKAKAQPKSRVRKKVEKVVPRMVARWIVFDNSMKRVAVFEYKNRAGADDKLAAARERKPGAYFLLLVKDPYDPPAEAGPAVPL
jgi:hypothetical protein